MDNKNKGFSDEMKDWIADCPVVEMLEPDFPILPGDDRLLPFLSKDDFDYEELRFDEVEEIARQDPVPDAEVNNGRVKSRKQQLHARPEPETNNIATTKRKALPLYLMDPKEEGITEERRKQILKAGQSKEYRESKKRKMEEMEAEKLWLRQELSRRTVVDRIQKRWT